MLDDRYSGPFLMRRSSETTININLCDDCQNYMFLFLLLVLLLFLFLLLLLSFFFSKDLMAKVIKDTPEDPIAYLIKVLKRLYSEGSKVGFSS